MTNKWYHIFLLDKEADKTDAKLRFRVRWGSNIVAFNVGFRVDVSKWSTETQSYKRNGIAKLLVGSNIQKIQYAKKSFAGIQRRSFS